MGMMLHNEPSLEAVVTAVLGSAAIVLLELKRLPVPGLGGSKAPRSDFESLK